MEKKYINIREENLSLQSLKNSLEHDFRLRKLPNVYHAHSQFNYYSCSVEELKKEIAKYKKVHQKLHIEKLGEKLRVNRTKSFTEGIITLPNSYGDDYRSGKLTVEQLNALAVEYKKQYEESGGQKILGYQIHLDETTPHIHYIATSFSLRDARVNRVKSGWLSNLQDIGAYSAQRVGLDLHRGISKKITKRRNQSQHEHYQEIMQTNKELTEKLEAGASLSDIEELLRGAKIPFKTLLTYIKRAMNREKEADYIIQQKERALKKAGEIFPDVEDFEDFDSLLDFIAKDKQAQKYKRDNTIKPRLQ